MKQPIKICQEYKENKLGWCPKRMQRLYKTVCETIKCNKRKKCTAFKEENIGQRL